MEYQQNWNPHFHGNVHTASADQHKTMAEIAEMMESNLLTFEALAKYQSWMHREHWIYRTLCLYTMSRAKPKKLSFAKAAGIGASVSSCVQEVSKHYEYKENIQSAQRRCSAWSSAHWTSSGQQIMSWFSKRPKFTHRLQNQHVLCSCGWSLSSLVLPYFLQYCPKSQFAAKDTPLRVPKYPLACIRPVSA